MTARSDTARSWERGVRSAGTSRIGVSTSRGSGGGKGAGGAGGGEDGAFDVRGRMWSSCPQSPRCHRSHCTSAGRSECKAQRWTGAGVPEVRVDRARKRLEEAAREGLRERVRAVR